MAARSEPPPTWPLLRLFAVLTEIAESASATYPAERPHQTSAASARGMDQQSVAMAQTPEAPLPVIVDDEAETGPINGGRPRCALAATERKRRQ